jgi:hypothetical protein
MGPAGQVSCTPPGGWGSDASFPAHSPMMSRIRMIHPIPAHVCTGFLGGRWSRGGGGVCCHGACGPSTRPCGCRGVLFLLAPAAAVLSAMPTRP